MTVLHGDCLFHLPQITGASIQLVYLDPPFFSQKSHVLRTRDNSNEYAFEDRWSSRDEYLLFMRNVLIEVRRILNANGSVFLHCDRSAAHHLRLLLDEVFGDENFQSEIIWSYKRWSNSKKGLLNAHQTIYFYSKTGDFKFNPIYGDYSPTTNIDQILQSRVRNEFGKSEYQRDEYGHVVIGPEKKGVPLSDVWNIPFLNPKANERVGYPTQKPILLLERIIELTTDVTDCIVDPFCGSGTTLVASKLLGRPYIGIDVSAQAVQLAETRLRELIKTESNLLTVGEDRYRGKSELERSVLKAMNAVPVERNSGIDGFLKFHVGGGPVSIRIQKRDEDLETAKHKLLMASRTKKCSVMVLIRTHRQSERLFSVEPPDTNLMVLDSYDLMIDSWLENHGRPGVQVNINSNVNDGESSLTPLAPLTRRVDE